MDRVQSERSVPTAQNNAPKPASPQAVNQFNAALNNPPLPTPQPGSSYPILNERQSPTDVLIQNSNRQESYWVPQGAAADAARAASLNQNVAPATTTAINGGGEAGGSIFVGVAGVSVSGGGNADSTGTGCAVATTCLQVGVGGFIGGGANATAGVGDPTKSGSTDTVGVFVSAGKGAAVNGSVNVDKDGNASGVKGGLGGGIGAAAGVQFCQVDSECTND